MRAWEIIMEGKGRSKIRREMGRRGGEYSKEKKTN